MKVAAPLLFLRLFLHLCTCFHLITSMSFPKPPKYAHLFTDYYSKGANIETLKADTSLLNPLVLKFDNHVSGYLGKEPELNRLMETLLRTFEGNQRLEAATQRKHPRKTQPSRKTIARNFEDLLVKVKLADGERFSDGFSKTNGKVQQKMSKFLEKLAEKPFRVEDKTVITFLSSDGFTPPVIDVLFRNTAPLRQLKPSQVVRKVSSSNNQESTFSVRLAEIVDEIVWLCVLRNCVRRRQIIKQGGVKQSPSYAKTEKAYIALYTARVKVLLYLVLFHRQQHHPQQHHRPLDKKIFTTTTKSVLMLTSKKRVGSKCKIPMAVGIIGGILGGVLYVSNVSRLLKRATVTPPPKFAPTTKGSAAIFGNPSFTLSCIALVLLVLGGAYYYHYHWRHSDEENLDEGGQKSNDEKIDGKRGKGSRLKGDAKKSSVEWPSKLAGQRSSLGSTILSTAKISKRIKGINESGAEKGEGGKGKQERTFSSVFNLNSSVDLKRVKLLSSLVEPKQPKKKNSPMNKQPGKQAIRRKVAATASTDDDDNEQSDSTIATTREVQRGELVTVKGKGKPSKANQKKKTSPPPRPASANRLASSIAPSKNSFSVVSGAVRKEGTQQQPTKQTTKQTLANLRAPSSVVPSSRSSGGGGGEVVASAVAATESPPEVPLTPQGFSTAAAAVSSVEKGMQGSTLRTNVPPLPSTAPSSAAAAGRAPNSSSAAATAIFKYHQTKLKISPSVSAVTGSSSTDSSGPVSSSPQ